MRIKIPTTEYISIHLMLLFIDVNEILFGPYVLFQYISCYCLSMIGLAKGDDHPVFQYISCYCLSASTASASTISSNFTTSHVTVYQWYYDSRLFTFIDFNTSHVTVYQILVMHHAFSFLISIHLMLLFIRMAAVGGERSIVFQYISCYCLSVSGFDSFISAHLFQYISCYCLSGLSLGLFNDQADFNTSHVTVYLLQ